MTDEQTHELLKWVGPSGHTSPDYGELVPGVSYPIPVTQVQAFLATPDCWVKATTKAKAKAEDE